MRKIHLVAQQTHTHTQTHAQKMGWKWTVTIAMMMAIIIEVQRRNGCNVQEMDIQIDALSATCVVCVWASANTLACVAVWMRTV